MAVGVDDRMVETRLDPANLVAGHELHPGELYCDVSTAVVTNRRVRVRALAGWVASIAVFYVALQLIWPTPLGIVVWGLVISSLTALLAFGLVLIYRSHRVINFAQADLGAVPASLCVSLVVLRGWSYWVAVPLALRRRGRARFRGRVPRDPAVRASAAPDPDGRHHRARPAARRDRGGDTQLLRRGLPAAEPAAAVRVPLRDRAVHLPRRRAGGGGHDAGGHRACCSRSCATRTWASRSARARAVPTAPRCSA